MTDKSSKEFVRSRGMYIAEAALEYLIAILVQSTFLARLTKEINCSDALTGIISSFLSLGCLFQLFSMFFRKRTVKKFVLILSITNQLLFMFLYVIPIVPISENIKILIFVIFLFFAYFLYNVAYPKKISWLMSLVDDRHRGSFTATKEIISLIAGIVFSFFMGKIIDDYKDAGNIKTAFILCAIVIFILMILHTITMLFSIEAVDEEKQERTGVIKGILSMFHEKNVLKVAVFFILYRIMTHCSAPFYGTFQNTELAFDQRLCVILTSAGSIARISVSRPMGRFADRTSFARLTLLGLIFIAISYITIAFANPTHLFSLTIFNWNVNISIGTVCFMLYYIAFGIASAGINNSLINMIFDYVPVEKRADSLAFCEASAGILGFVTTLVISPLVTHIQQNGNTVFGIPMYAQQFTSLIAAAFAIIAIFYVSAVIMKGQKDQK